MHLKFPLHRVSDIFFKVLKKKTFSGWICDAFRWILSIFSGIFGGELYSSTSEVGDNSSHMTYL